MSERWARVARGTAAAAFATFAAALSHTLGGATVPSAFVVVVGFTFAMLVCVGLAGRRINRIGVAASVLVSQLAYHFLFSVASGSAAASVVPQAGASSALHQHDAVIQMQVTTTGASAGSASGAHMHGGSAMWVAHVLAAIVTVAAVLYAERWMRAAVTALHRRVLPVFAIVALSLIPSPRRVRWARVNSFPRRMGVILLHLRHRGPPMVFAAL